MYLFFFNCLQNMEKRLSEAQDRDEGLGHCLHRPLNLVTWSQKWLRETMKWLTDCSLLIPHLALSPDILNWSFLQKPAGLCFPSALSHHQVKRHVGVVLNILHDYYAGRGKEDAVENGKRILSFNGIFLKSCNQCDVRRLNQCLHSLG